jgi:acetylornithine deacetylase/succinyl-diaminopimelate desuccinylase-like protein
MPRTKRPLTGPTSAARAAIHEHDRLARSLLEQVADLVRVPSVSAPGFPADHLSRGAEATAAVLRQCGLDNVRVLHVPDAPPYVYADWLRQLGAPTVLIYGHYDVQPPGRPELWVSPAFAPEERHGRLFGRGTVDDKGGFMAHVGAIACYLASIGTLPCNVRVLIEGEEETGSAHLPELIKKYRSLLDADYAILSDTANWDTGVPALTYRLRGLSQVDVEVRCLEHPIHSGFWGGPVPDAARILCQLIAGLEDERGRIAVPGLYRRVARGSVAERNRLRRLPFKPTKFKRDAAMLKGVDLAGERGYSPYELLWTRPSLTLLGIESHPIQGSFNQVIESARARLSLRTVPRMDAHEAGRLIIKELRRRAPHGAHVAAQVTETAPWWETDPTGPAFEAALRALKAGFRRDPVVIGSGATIGFIRPLVDLLGGLPCLLLGIEDPPCAAHSENESIHLDDWMKLTRSVIYLLDELSRLPR